MGRGENVLKKLTAVYIQKGLTLEYTTPSLNLFNSHSFSNALNSIYLFSFLRRICSKKLNALKKSILAKLVLINKYDIVYYVLICHTPYQSHLCLFSYLAPSIKYRLSLIHVTKLYMACLTNKCTGFFQLFFNWYC